MLALSSLIYLASLTSLTSALTLTFTLPAHLSLPGSTTAYLQSHSYPTLSTPLSRRNTFTFNSISFPPLHTISSASSSTQKSQKQTLFLKVVSRDWDFATYAIAPITTAKSDEVNEVEVYRTGPGGQKVAEAIRVKDGGNVEVRALKGREFYEDRVGFSPLTLLKNPMVLIGIVGLAFVMGMPYLMENMDPETRAEFEQAQKKSILGGIGGGGGGAAKENPLQNFDMAAWMAGTGKKSSASDTVERNGEGDGKGGEKGASSGGGGDGGKGKGGGGGGGVRRRG